MQSKKKKNFLVNLKCVRVKLLIVNYYIFLRWKFKIPGEGLEWIKCHKWWKNNEGL